MNDDFIPVAFATLTERNGTTLWRLLDDVSRFIWEVAKSTKVHIKPFIGYEDGSNSHAHLILAVSKDEHSRWVKRASRLKPWKFWRFKTLDFQEWKGVGNTFGYVLEKHTPLLPEIVCPRRARSCRSGRCVHSK